MGIVAMGDSIVAADDSWAYWLSRAMGLPLRNLAVGGSRSDDVVGQLARSPRRSTPWPACRWAPTTSCSTGTPSGSRTTWRRSWRQPRRAPSRWWCRRSRLGLAGFPGTGAEFRRRAEQANSILERSGALVFSGSDLRGPRTMSPDRIHPTTGRPADPGGPGSRGARESRRCRRRWPRASRDPIRSDETRRANRSAADSATMSAQAAVNAVMNAVARASPRTCSSRGHESSIPCGDTGKTATRRAQPTATSTTARPHRARPSPWARWMRSRSTEAASRIVNAG